MKPDWNLESSPFPFKKLNVYLKTTRSIILLTQLSKEIGR